MERPARVKIILLMLAVIGILFSGCCRKTIECKPFKGQNRVDCDSTTDVANNPKCYRVYADTHVYYPGKQVCGAGAEFERMIQQDSLALRQGTFFLGDIYEYRRNHFTLDKTVNKKIDNLRHYADGHYVRGNHEMNAPAFGPIGENYLAFNNDGDVMFTHGHRLFAYGKGRADYWENGAVWRDRTSDRTKFPGKEFDRRVGKYISRHPDLKYIIVGHKHNEAPIKKGDRIVGYRIPQGCRYLYLE